MDSVLIYEDNPAPTIMFPRLSMDQEVTASTGVVTNIPPMLNGVIHEAIVYWALTE